VSVENAPKLASDSKMFNAISRATQDAAKLWSDSEELVHLRPEEQPHRLTEAVISYANG